MLDGVVLVSALWAAYLLRYDFSIPAEAVRSALLVTPFVVGLQIAALRHYGVHRVVGRYVSFDDLGACVERCVAIAADLGLETLVLDQTRADIGLPVVKVIVPGLRHFTARLGPGRLYDVPVTLGRKPRPSDENDLNPSHIVI